MSVWVMAIVAARIAVKMPIAATMTIASGAEANSSFARATRYTPALTIVAAWMRADTGVGPSIASGSQTWSGNWALLPMAPANTSSAVANSGIGLASPASSIVWIDSRMFSVASPTAPGVDPDGHDPERETDVADAVDDERLLGRQRRRALAVPEADEQVAAQADQLPGHEHHEPRVREDQQQHREHEQVQVGEEPPVARVVAHVADRVDVDEQADRRDDDEQARGQRVDDEADLDDESRRPGSR